MSHEVKVSWTDLKGLLTAKVLKLQYVDYGEGKTYHIWAVL